MVFVLCKRPKLGRPQSSWCPVLPTSVLLLKNPFKGLLSFSFFVSVGIVFLYFVKDQNRLGRPQSSWCPVLLTSVPPAKKSSSRLAFLFFFYWRCYYCFCIFFIGICIVVSVLCNCLAWGIHSVRDVQVLPISTPPETSSSSSALAFSKWYWLWKVFAK